MAPRMAVIWFLSVNYHKLSVNYRELIVLSANYRKLIIFSANETNLANKLYREAVPHDHLTD